MSADAAEMDPTRLEALAAEGRHLLVLPIFLAHALLRLSQERFRHLGIGMGERTVAELVVGVFLERDGRTRRVEPKRVLAGVRMAGLKRNSGQ